MGWTPRATAVSQPFSLRHRFPATQRLALLLVPLTLTTTLPLDVEASRRYKRGYPDLHEFFRPEALLHVPG